MAHPLPQTRRGSLQEGVGCFTGFHVADMITVVINYSTTSINYGVAVWQSKSISVACPSSSRLKARLQ